MQSSINFEIDKINIVEGETSLLSTFLVNYYEKRPLPSNIYTNFKDSDFKLFSESRKIKVFFDIKEDISNILDDNLKCLEEEINKKNSDWDAFNKAISSFLKTDKNYITVECYDASNIGGSVTVGAKVAFNKAKSDKSLYRKYVLKDYKGDDLLAISEVLKRRIKSEDTLPDIIIIDGGKTQLNVAFDILRNKNVLLLSIAKGRDVLEDKVYIIKDDKICNLKIDNLNYIKKLRDEVHRFVIKFHREKREKNFLTKNLKKSI
jgi:excinuclease ABC subunit C